MIPINFAQTDLGWPPAQKTVWIFSRPHPRLWIFVDSGLVFNALCTVCVPGSALVFPTRPVLELGMSLTLYLLPLTSNWYVRPFAQAKHFDCAIPRRKVDAVSS